MKINTILLVFVAILLFSCSGTDQAQEEVVIIKTRFGDMVAILYDETPNHKENFLSIARTGKYDSTIFHKVIKEYNIVGGDTGKVFLEDSPGEFPAEIVPNLFHQKGAISAARRPDAVNPSKLSHGCQFFITQGAIHTPKYLQYLENLENAKILNGPLYTILNSKQYPELNARMDSLKKNLSPREVNQLIPTFRDDLFKIIGPLKEFKFSEAQKELYSTKGGRPDLDGQYSIFGQVISGLHIVDSIANQELDRFGMPINKVYMDVAVKKMTKEEVSKKYGYQYPQLIEK